MIVQALHDQDGTLLSGLTVQNMYTELRKGSKKAVVVVQNHTAYPQTLQKKMPVVRAIPVLLLAKAPQTWEPTGSRWSMFWPSNSAINDQAKTWQAIWWVRLKWFRFVGSCIGR